MFRILLSLFLVAFASNASAADNYAATAGSGLTFGAKDAAGVLYSRFIGCDNTTVSQCWTVNASGQLVVSVANTNANGQAVMASSSPVVIASNQTANALWGHGVTGAAVPANATYLGFNSGGNLVGPASATPLPVRTGDGTRQAVIDPCEAATQTYAPISITTATTTRIVTPSASNKTYICGLILVTAAANNVGIVEGTGGTCGSATAGVIGGTTAANGPNYSANGGMVLQASKTAHAQTAGTNVDLCLITSAATPLAGGIRYVQAP